MISAKHIARYAPQNGSPYPRLRIGATYFVERVQLCHPTGRMIYLGAPRNGNLGPMNEKHFEPVEARQCGVENVKPGDTIVWLSTVTAGTWPVKVETVQLWGEDDPGDESGVTIECKDGTVILASEGDTAYILKA